MSKSLATKNVAAILVASALVFGFAFSFAKPANADTLSDLQAQVQALLAQIASMQGSGSSTTTTTSGTSCHTFTQNLQQGASGGEVMWVQQFLNGHGAQVSASGAGSPGNETSYFGPATKAAVIAWQNANAAAVLTPVGLTSGTGNWFSSSRAAANAMCAGSTTTTTTTTTTGTGTGTTVPGSLNVSAGAQPANSLAPMKATRVPFTTFTLTNSSNVAVTINGITVQRTGLANDNAFAGVILLDSTGLQYGNAQTFNSNHQTTIGGTFTLQPGQSTTYTVAGNMETSQLGNSGQIASITVIGINTSATVAGSLPITGAQQTVNESLTIGTASLQRSSYDPNSNRSYAIGTTGTIFGGIRMTANAEDQKLFSITWNQVGSAGSGDLSNLHMVVNGVNYPVSVDASGKYYTATIPGGVLITKGNSVDAYIQGDITGSNASGRTVEFDVYRSSDIYLVGQTYGYGITPTSPNGVACTPSGTILASCLDSAATHGSNFSFNTQPFFQGSTSGITGGTLSTVSTASSVAPQNIAVNVPNQTLGGFSTNFTGEAVTVQKIVINVSTSSATAGLLQNNTLVDQNGNVVAGPVDSVYASSGQSTITFNSSVTFPVGAMTYTIKGTVATGALNGNTYTLSTNPANWTSAVGQTSGTYITLPTTVITMSTMTVRSGQLNISASASPAATALSQNQSNYTIANIVLDATQSGEDVRLNSLPIIVSATNTAMTNTANSFNLQANLTNCQLYNGTTALNSQSVGSGQWVPVTNLAGTGGELTVNGIEYNFVFTNSLTITKGTSVTLALKCNIGGALINLEKFSAGVDNSSANYIPTVTGASSGNTIASGAGLTVTPGTSGAMTIGTATLAATVPTPISYAQVPGGTTGVTIGTFTLQPQSGTVNLQNVGIQLNSNMASSSDLANGQVTIWQGSTQVGTASFNGVTASSTLGTYTATSTIASGFSIAQNAQTVFTIKADIAAIGLGQSAISGHEIRVSLSDANGTSGNTQVDSGALALPTTGVAIFRTVPSSVSLSALPSGGVSDGRLIAFSVTANAANPVGINQFVFTFASSTGVTIVAPTLYAYQDSGFSQPAGGTTNGIAGTTTYTNPAAQIATSTMATPLQVPAGTTWYFLLKAASVSFSGAGTTYNIATTLKGDSSDLAPVMYASSASALLANNNTAFIWSPNSTTTSATTTTDWTNGFGINGLPSIGITQNRTQ